MPFTASKKALFPVTPDPILENHPVQAQTIIVIQPGSVNLRIGRASDAIPITVPHCIARRSHTKCPSDDYMLLRPECNHADAGQQMRTGLSVIQELLLSQPTSSGEYRQITQPRQLMHFNSQKSIERAGSGETTNWTDCSKRPSYLVGEEALYVSPDEPYFLSWPIRCGRLYEHSGPGGSLTNILANIEAIWGYVLQEQLEIPLKDLKHYRAVLLIPDVYVHRQVKGMVNLLLNSLGFGAVIVHQESVCATYGSGVTVACVVDVGDQKTSVSCVEDGLSHRASRVTMDYGGSDVSRLFHSLLARCGVSLPDLHLSRAPDVVQMQGLKETCCHLNQDNHGVTQQTLEVQHPGGSMTRYNVHLGDECILAPMALLRPVAFGLIHGSTLIHTQTRAEPDVDDPYDEDYLRQTQRQSWAGRIGGSKKGNAEVTGREVLEQNLSNLDDPEAVMDEDSNDVPEILPTIDNKSLRRPEDEEEDELNYETNLELMGLDDAIIHSIEKCESEELQRRLYSCILVVGGGFQFEGATSWLQHQVTQAMSDNMRTQLESMDIISKPKDIDSSLTSWKGGAILACLDSTQELWIRQKEWKKFSVRMLRERAPFNW